MMKTPDAPIAVLGGSGFIGTHLTNRLAQLGRPFRVGDLVPSPDHPDRFHPCDVRVESSMSSVLSGARAVINLAAEHRDDVRPISRYFETNVEGAKQVCQAATVAGIKQLLFTSSVAVYGFQGFAVDEFGPFDPFNAYGETKLLAEGIYRDWAARDPERALVIIRPTVVFGEGNRGNVYNLLKQIASGRFKMVGKGLNRKSMAYVGNVADALVYCLALGPGTHIFNYVDGPDMDMNELVALVHRSLNRPTPSRLRIPLPLAMAGGHLLDGVARLTGQTFPVSAIRVRKFCENTQINADRIRKEGFQPNLTLAAALDQTIKKELS